MRTLLCWLLALSGPLGAAAQSPAVPQTPAAPPAASASPQPESPESDALYVSDAERRYFELGDVLARAAFTYAPLAGQTRQVTRAGMTDTQLAQIGKLAPDALKARSGAQALLNRAVVLMQGLDAPDAVLRSFHQLALHESKPLTPTGDALNVAVLNRDAGTVLAALAESDRLSRVLDGKALQAWVLGSGSDPTGRVWYGEGLMAGVAGVASSLGQPGLLPPTPALATDLRGLRDWLSLRVPETPTPDQTALQTAIDKFLAQTAANAQHPKPLSIAQLHDLGEISRMLQTQILPPDSPAAAPGADPTGPPAVPGPTMSPAIHAPPLNSHGEETGP